MPTVAHLRDLFYDGNGAVLPYEQIVAPMLSERFYGGIGATDREGQGSGSGGTGQRIGRNGAADREGRSSGSGGTGQRIGRDGAADREERGGPSQAERFVHLGFSGYLLTIKRR